MRRQAILGFFLIIFTLTLFAFNPKTGLANSPVRVSDYTKTTPDNAYLLVMFLTADKPDYYHEFDQNLRDEYKVSGLYKNDGSTTPLWTVDWWDDSESVFLSSDAKHLTHLTRFLSNDRYDTLQNDAIYFYENGNVIRRYEFADLIRNSANLPHPFFDGPWSYSWIRSYHFDDGKDRLDLSTKFGEEYRFDVTTGKTVFDLPDLSFISKIPLPVFILAGVILIGIIWAVIEFISVFRNGKSNQ